MKINNEYCTYYRISKEFEIELDNGDILNVCKWLIDSDSETDSDYEFTAESQKDFDKLPEEQQEDIIDFINDIKL